MSKRKTTEEFIEEAKKVHGDKYDYSKVEYVNARTKVCIVCPEHGEFWQIPDSHLRGRGCRLCGRDVAGNKKRIHTYEACFQDASKYETLKEFRLNSNVSYVISYKNGWIKDYAWLKHKQKSSGYWNNQKICKNFAAICKNTSDFKEKYGRAWFYSNKNGWLDEFFPQRQKKIHWVEESALAEAKKYISKIDLKSNNNGLYTYICKNKLMEKCDWFVKPKLDNSKLVQAYIDKAKEKYKGFYDYSQIDINNVNYVSHTKVPIICPEHGMFKQNLYQHLNCVCPCSLCRQGINTKSDNKNKIQTVIQDKIRHGIIYCYTNKNNGKKYIGQTIEKEKRKYKHLSVNQKHKTLFDKILQKKGEENFEYEILFEIDEKRSKIFDILDEKEKYYIKLYNSQVPNGYNISEGGRSVKWMVGYKPTQETLQKLRDSHKGKQNPMKGKHYSEEQRKRMIEKRRNTMQEKFNNGYITQRKNIIVFKNKQNKGTYPNAKEIERVFGVNYKRVHYALKRMQPLDNKWIFIYEENYSDYLLDNICTKTSIQQKI